MILDIQKITQEKVGYLMKRVLISISGLGIERKSHGQNPLI